MRFFPDDWEQRFQINQFLLTYWDDDNSILVVDSKKTLDKNIDTISDDDIDEEGNI